MLYWLVQFPSWLTVCDFSNDTSAHAERFKEASFVLSQTFFIFQKTMKCPNCLQLLTSDSKNYVVTTPCGHLAHNNCIQFWLERGNKSCPQCRKILTIKEFLKKQN